MGGVSGLFIETTKEKVVAGRLFGFILLIDKTEMFESRSKQRSRSSIILIFPRGF